MQALGKDPKSKYPEKKIDYLQPTNGVKPGFYFLNLTVIDTLINQLAQVTPVPSFFASLIMDIRNFYTECLTETKPTELLSVQQFDAFITLLANQKRKLESNATESQAVQCGQYIENISRAIAPYCSILALESTLSTLKPNWLTFENIVLICNSGSSSCFLDEKWFLKSITYLKKMIDLVEKNGLHNPTLIAVLCSKIQSEETLASFERLLSKVPSEISIDQLSILMKSDLSYQEKHLCFMQAKTTKKLWCLLEPEFIKVIHMHPQLFGDFLKMLYEKFEKYFYVDGWHDRLIVDCFTFMFSSAKKLSSVGRGDYLSEYTDVPNALMQILIIYDNENKLDQTQKNKLYELVSPSLLGTFKTILELIELRLLDIAFIDWLYANKDHLKMISWALGHRQFNYHDYLKKPIHELILALFIKERFKGSDAEFF